MSRKRIPVQQPGRSRQDYGTPPVFLHAVRRRLEITDFAIDLAAHQENRVVPLYMGPDRTDGWTDALQVDWSQALRKSSESGWGWLNPPFAHLAPWVKKAYGETRRGAQLAVLVPAAVGSNWWRDWVDQKAEVWFLNGRLTFVGETAPYPKDCALLLYEPDVAPEYEVWCWKESTT